jgi:hypothetical protein
LGIYYLSKLVKTQEEKETGEGRRVLGRGQKFWQPQRVREGTYARKPATGRAMRLKFVSWIDASSHLPTKAMVPRIHLCHVNFLASANPYLPMVSARLFSDMSADLVQRSYRLLTAFKPWDLT